MATKKRNPQTVVPDHSQSAEADVFDNLDYSDDIQVALCPSCGDLLAWHEAACSPAAAPPPTQAADEQDNKEIVAVASSSFAFGLGRVLN